MQINPKKKKKKHTHTSTIQNKKQNRHTALRGQSYEKLSICFLGKDLLKWCDSDAQLWKILFGCVVQRLELQS